jgi:hypothetical protein
MKKTGILLFIASFMLLAGNMYAADELKFIVQAPSTVVQGSQFQLAYSINTQKVKDFRMGSTTDFDILMGPSRSSQFSMVNGETSSSITYTYVLRGKKEGTYTIPPATITAGGKTLESNSVTIKVLPPDQTTGGQGSDGSSSSSSRGSGSSASSQGVSPSSSGTISDNDIFIIASANKTKVYEQEAILLTYKVYTTVNLTELSGKMPDLKGFAMQEVELPANKEFTLEHYKGRNYKTLVWRQFVLFPQQSGTLEIPSVTYEGTILQQSRTIDPLDIFFNGGSSFTKVQKSLRTPKLNIEVKPLPAGKPASYCSGVGEFSISSDISTQELKENEAVTVRLVISGTGNMKLLKTPEINFPADFEVYDPKIENNFKLKASGLSGNKVIEYLAIPRHAGDYEIPSVQFSYFDTKLKAYRTLSTPTYQLKVARGDGSTTTVTSGYVNKEDLKLLGKDIRYINLNDAVVKPKGNYFFGTFGFWLYYIIPSLLLLAALIIWRKKAAENANIAKVKTRKANKVATRRLRNAKKLMNGDDDAAFYDEILKALWGYTSDKMNIPVSKLSKDNIASELAEHGVDELTIGEFTTLLSNCEFARYAPAISSVKVEDIYNHTVDLIDKMEGSIHR